MNTAHEIIHMSETPSQLIMIYIPELWDVRKGTACDCGEKIVKRTGDPMLSPLDMNDNKITRLHTPNDASDAANKEYVDSETAALKSDLMSGLHPIITVFATSRNDMRANSYEWHFGEGGRENHPGGYKMLASGKILASAIDITLQNNRRPPNNISYACIVVKKSNGSMAHYSSHTISTRSTKYDTPIEINMSDVLTFKTIRSLQGVQCATISVLIKLDIYSYPIDSDD